MITNIKDIKVNLYRILDLSPDACHNDILHAYQRVKMAYEKDALASYSLIDEEASTEILEEVEFAYSILGQASKRREYDLAMGYAEKEDFSQEKELRPQPLPKVKARNKVETLAERSEEKQKLSPSLPKNEAFESEIATCQELNGAFLRSVRLYRGFSEEQLAQLCQLNPHHIFSIEEEDSNSLVHPTYLRGHLLLICRYLEIENAQDLVKAFIHRLQIEKKLPSTSFAV